MLKIDNNPGTIRNNLIIVRLQFVCKRFKKSNLPQTSFGKNAEKKQSLPYRTSYRTC